MIIYKSIYLHKLCQIILVQINKNLKVCYYFALFALILAINLKIKNNKRLLFDSKKRIE